jgi:hypothetical protein
LRLWFEKIISQGMKKANPLVWAMVAGAGCAAIVSLSNLFGMPAPDSILMESASKACLGGLIWGYVLALIFNWYGKHLTSRRP